MKMRERLRGIPDLILTKRLQMMSNIQLDAYTALLYSFVDSFPALEAEIKTAMEAKDFKSVTRHLTRLQEILISIHADELADECWKRLNNFDEERPDKIETYVSFLLSTLNALSIDIQLAFYKEEDESLPVPSGCLDKEANTVKTILAVDDDAYSLDIFKTALKNVSCKIIGATSGISALGVLNNLKPALFVLDIEMPGMNGIELAAEIRTHGQNAPIMFITGKSSKEYVQKCMQAGASDFIIKPINPQDAAKRIQRFL
ncbi:MAG: response regulator [Treponema sp.]|nr:response regulator [Treponema sp.]